MKNNTHYISLVLSLAALAIAVFCLLSMPSLKYNLGRQDPGEAVKAYVSFQARGEIVGQAESAYLTENGSEIMNTLEIAEVDESERHCAVFYRYSIGAKIFRKVEYLMKVEDKWYLAFDWEYSDNKPADSEWSSEVMKKAEEWVKDSATTGFEY